MKNNIPVYIKISFVTLFVFVLPILTGWAAGAAGGGGGTAAAVEEKTLAVYRLRVTFEVERNLVKGFSTITLPDETSVYVGGLNIVFARLNNEPFDPRIIGGEFNVPKGTLEIAYEGIFGAGGEGGGGGGDLVSEAGISLTGSWYPRIEGLALFELNARLPRGFMAISEADEIKVEADEYSFRFLHPVSGINLAAGRYTELKESFNGIDIYGYFFPEDTHLAPRYLEYTKRYLEMYEDLLGPYPYKRFSVVENVLPTGLSMPTFTLLGRRVVHLPFIVETSLGHEVLHQWFGNSVYVDYEKGNWVEALTSYLADHLYEEQEGRGWGYRKKILIDYLSYVTPSNEIVLKDFVGRRDSATRAIGYGKGAMLFHMLNGLLGEDAFYDALKGFLREKRFRLASWQDLKAAFEKVSERELGWFFAQWLERKGTVSFEIKDPGVTYVKGVPTVSFSVVQTGEPYRFLLPVKIITDAGMVYERLEVREKSEFFEIPASGTVLEAVFDEGYDIMRTVGKEEVPPVVSRLLGDEKRLVTVPEEDGRYKDLIEALKAQGFRVKREGEISDADIRGFSLLILGVESPVVKRLFGELELPGEGGEGGEGPEPRLGFTFLVKDNPLNPSGVVAVAQGDSKEEVSRAAGKIFRYGKYGLLRFENGKNVVKEVEGAERGLMFVLYEDYFGIEPEKTLTLDEIIERVAGKTIIYVGETHVHYEDHRLQLEVIRKLHERGGKLAIGMEMFQRPFQKALDDYMKGAVTEKEFLRASEYFTRWNVDYLLYREIIDFAKANGIPVVALNAASEIVKKVSRGGLDALTDEEKKQVPEDMDLSDEAYKERLMEVFEEHRNHERTDFENFYLTQILWDETMAHSVDEFLNENPDHRMVVLAGSGHVIFGSGIAERAYRLNGKQYATVINGSRGVLEKGKADFVLFLKPIEPPVSPKLMVYLRREKAGMEVTGFPEESISRRAGLEKGDVIISVGGEKIRARDDVRIALFDRKPGETIKVRVLRKRLLFGEKELEFEITF